MIMFCNNVINDFFYNNVDNDGMERSTSRFNVVNDFNFYVTYISKCLQATSLANGEEKYRDEICISTTVYSP